MWPIEPAAQPACPGIQLAKAYGFALAGFLVAIALTQPLAYAQAPTSDFELRTLRDWREELAGSFDRRRAVWTGFGVAYGPYRDGQEPGVTEPSKEQIREDLKLIAKHWKMLRVYSSGATTRHVCQVIREEKLPLYVMVGAWLAEEAADDPPSASNRRQVDQAVALAKDYPESVIAICVGNETQESFSDHQVATDRLIDYVCRARQATADMTGADVHGAAIRPVPITVADVDAFWLRPRSQAVADKIDFIVTHTYAMWHAKKLHEAIPYTKQKFAEVRQRHPNKLCVLGETGWATDRSDQQAERIAGEVGEAPQAEFLRQFKKWTTEEDRIVSFYFEAFDENWKKSVPNADPRDVEKHWGIYNADRTPKLAAKQLQ
ncbi:MAG: glycosyl hydrolase family 17 protein [Planctomycetota bacterium]